MHSTWLPQREQCHAQGEDSFCVFLLWAPGLVEYQLQCHGVSNAIGSIAQMSGAKLNACCCGVKGCLDFRRRYRDGVSTLTLTKAAFPEARLRRHLKCLRLTEAQIDALVLRQQGGGRVRVAMWHYFPDDRSDGKLNAKTTDLRALQARHGADLK